MISMLHQKEVNRDVEDVEESKGVDENEDVLLFHQGSPASAFRFSNDPHSLAEGSKDARDRDHSRKNNPGPK